MSRIILFLIFLAAIVTFIIKMQSGEIMYVDMAYKYVITNLTHFKKSDPLPGQKVRYIMEKDGQTVSSVGISYTSRYNKDKATIEYSFHDECISKVVEELNTVTYPEWQDSDIGHDIMKRCHLTARDPNDGKVMDINTYYFLLEDRIIIVTTTSPSDSPENEAKVQGLVKSIYTY